MLNLKHISKRTLRRDRDDDLSIITAGRGRPSIKGPKGAFNNSRRVRQFDQKLKQEFLNARAFAYHSQGAFPPASSASASYTATALSANRPVHLNRTVPAPSNENDPVLTSHAPHNQNQNVMGPQRQQRSEVTIDCVPSLVKTSQSRQAVLSASQPRGILKPSNQMYGHVSATPPYQTQSWSMHANTGGVNKTRISSTIYNMNTRGGNRHTSTWKVCSTAPITREDASLLQMEMISTMNGDSSSHSSVSRYFAATPVQGQETLQGRYSTTRQGCMPPPSLVRSIVPPAPSPLFPVPPSPAGSLVSNSSSLILPSNFNGCGVHQSEWMDRSKCFSGKAPTKQYSMEQLIDILCGFATPDSIMADQLFQPFPTPAPPTPMRSSTSEPSNQLHLSSHWNASPPSNQINTIISNATTNEKQKEDGGGGDNNDDDGETSIYFRNVQTTTTTTTNQKKSVTFLTDSSDNICVNEFMFDPVSQERADSGSSRNSAEKEHIADSSLTEIFFHGQAQQDASLFDSLQNIFPSQTKQHDVSATLSGLESIFPTPAQEDASTFNSETSSHPLPFCFQFNCFNLPELTFDSQLQLFDDQPIDDK